ncbi:MAG: ABC transporter ATP-binding protein [Planctomycetes bacterium]|nr:ABC transporter ATP-binding protein [Planctomycetota bacterium]
MNKFIETIRQYSATLKLIAADSVWRFKKQSIFILLAGFLGTSFQLLTIGLAIYYAHALEKGGIVKLLGYEFQARTSIVLLFLLGTGVFLFLLLSAWLIYFSKTKTIALMRKYEEFCAKRIFSLFGSSIKVWTPPNQSFIDDRTISRLVRIDSRNNSRAMGILLVTVVPAITLLVSVCTLFYTNISLTCLMIVFFGIASFFQYKINIVGVRNSTRMDNYVRGSALEYNQIIQRQKGISIPLSKNESWFEKEIFSSGKIKQYIDAYAGRLKVLETSHLVSNILFAITIFVLLLIMGSRIIFKADNWSSLIVYLIALRFLLVNLRQFRK